MNQAAPAKPETAVALTGGDAPQLTAFEVIERVISSGDLSAMAPEARIAFYWRTCESLGLNPLTRPFDFIRGDGGQIIMYAKRDATDQLRKIHHTSVDELTRTIDDDYATVEARGSIVDPRAPGGIRRDSALGSVTIKGLSGQARANGIMKAETKAKRRLTLSLVGLGFLDETEVEGMPRADFDLETGALKAEPTSLLDAVKGAAAKMTGDGPATPADERATDARPDTDPAAAPNAAQDAIVELEGEATWLDMNPGPVQAGGVPEPAPAVVDLRKLSAITATVDADPADKASPEQLEALARIFAGWDRDMVRDGFRALFGRVTPLGPQVEAVRLVFADLGAFRFLTAWRAMLAEAGA